ncbi:tail fiber [Caudoviricetes sp.]|nr:tail fiber [Caudoviricetes sp.]
MTAVKVKETTTGTGTSDLTLAGAVSGYRTFNTAYGTNRRFFYFIQHTSANEWEDGVGYLSGSTTLVREQVRHSTNSNAAVNFSSGTKNVFVGMTAHSFIMPMTGYQNISTRGIPSGHICQGTPGGTQASGANKLRLTPFLLEIPIVATGMRIEITTAAASSKARMGLYEMKPNGLPGNLVFETADVDTSTTGFKTGTATAKFFWPGWYWSACGGDNGSVVFRRHLQGGYRPSPMGGNSSTAASDSCMLYSLAGGWTTLPTSDPSTTNSDDSTGCLYINLVGDVV